MLETIQDWFASNCNGQWEHECGVKIETIDNPGWYIEIDLSDTPLDSHGYESQVVERSDSDWFNCKVERHKFVAGCGVRNLSEVLEEFRNWRARAVPEADQNAEHPPSPSEDAEK